MNWKAIRAVVREEIRAVRSKAKGMIRRGVLRSGKASGKVQTATVATLADQERDDVELLEQYGLTSVPPVGSEGVVLHPGGDTAHPLGVAFGSRAVRPTDLGVGDVALYSLGQSEVRIRADGSIAITNVGGASVQINPAGAVSIVGVGPVELGGGTQLAVARQTDAVAPSDAMAAWGSVIEGAINGLVPGTFTPANSFAGTVGSDFASIAAGGTGATSS